MTMTMTINWLTWSYEKMMYHIIFASFCHGQYARWIKTNCSRCKYDTCVNNNNWMKIMNALKARKREHSRGARIWAILTNLSFNSNVAQFRFSGTIFPLQSFTASFFKIQNHLVAERDSMVGWHMTLNDVWIQEWLQSRTGFFPSHPP